jgi:hypothetical protein
MLSSMIAIAYANSIYIIRTLSGGIASLNVGTPETPFDVHIELLCDSSPYFNNLFNDRFDRVPPATVRLPDDDPDTFTEFLNWVYRGTIFQNQLHPPLIELFRLWVLAQKFEVPELQNLVVTRCKQKLDYQKKGVLPTNTINYVYNNTIPGSPLRQMTVNIFAQRATKANFSRYREEVPRAFLEDLCVFWLEKGEIIDPGVNLSPDFETLYFVYPATPLKDSQGRILSPRREEEPEIVRPATSDEIESRKIITPRSRKRSDRAISSTGIGTPSTTSTDTEREREISQNLENLDV